MKEILLTSILSAAATAFLSYFLIQSQLKSEQDYWMKRQQYEQSTQKTDKRIKLIREFNEQYLKLSLLSSEVKFKASTAYATLQICREAATLKADDYKCDSTKIDEFIALNDQFKQETYSLYVTLQMLPLYFSESVTKLIPKISKVVEENTVVTGPRGDYKFGRPIDEFYDQNFGPNEEFMYARRELITAMLNDIQK